MEITSVVLSLLLTGILCMGAVASFNDNVESLGALIRAHRSSLIYTNAKDSLPFSSCSLAPLDIPIRSCDNEKTERLVYVW